MINKIQNKIIFKLDLVERSELYFFYHKKTLLKSKLQERGMTILNFTS